MGGRAVFRERNRTRRVEQRGEVEIEFQLCVAGKVERSGKSDARAVGVAREVVGPTVKRAARVAPHAFDRQENVAALPAPMQSVEVRVQRMARRKFAGLRMVIGRLQPTVKTGAP